MAMNIKIASLLLFLAYSRLFADQSVTLAWDHAPEPDVNAYIVHYGTNSRAYPLSTNVGNVTTATVYGLAEDRKYFFAITAKNTSGLESDFSNEVTNSIPASVTNNSPTIAAIGDVILRQSGYTNLPFRVWDIETFPGDLMVAASSTNQSLIPASGLTITGTNWDRFLNIEPNPMESGKTLITVVVSDGSKASSTSFFVNVISIPTAPIRLNFISNIQVSDSPSGPWENIVTTVLPVDTTINSNKFYRTWLDVKP